jgi:hypothetical protein
MTELDEIDKGFKTDIDDLKETVKDGVIAKLQWMYL